MVEVLVVCKVVVISAENFGRYFVVWCWRYSFVDKQFFLKGRKQPASHLFNTPKTILSNFCENLQGVWRKADAVTGKKVCV